MLVISAREFRNKQKSYLDKIDEGVELVLKSKSKSYKILPIIQNDTLMSKEEFFEKLNRAEQDYVEGRYRVLETKDDIKNLLGL